MVMMFFVNVLVLPGHNMPIRASSSMAANRDTMACFPARAPDPRAIVEVHTTCTAMGIDAANSTQIPSVIKTPKLFGRSTAMMNDTRNKNTARRKRVVE